ncbi:MAG: ABC transporter ATP-binding protein [Holosporales bacterium]|jgi:lipoprotein-releasing system ATP-binding protein|nr:ABC transporter ATP-binding protein [Holosporales bacterium]
MMLKLASIVMKYKSGDSFISVLDGASLLVGYGESVGVVGQSGIGKSTLLQIAGLLENPIAGDVIINGQNVKKLTDDEKTVMRRNDIGFVYQHHNLLPEFTALENVMIPLLVSKVPKREAADRAMQLLDDVGLSHRVNHNSRKLSGGEQQRTSIARAMANNPNILIADEPTGNLDPSTAEAIFRLFVDLTRRTGVSLLMATHNIGFATKLDKTVQIRNGTIQSGLFNDLQNDELRT